MKNIENHHVKNVENHPEQGTVNLVFCYNLGIANNRSSNVDM